MNSYIKIFNSLAALILVSGCVSSDMSDLDAWRDEVLSRSGGRIEPLPEIKPYEAYTYKSASEGLRDPFQAFYQQREDTEKKVDQNAGLTAEMERELRNRNREELEKYELDSLKMVGTMNNDGNNWGIVQDPDGNVTRVRVGNYIGRNIGKIVNIYEDRIELREIVQNNQGRWEERQAAIALIELE
ncbi:MAG: pilus assembly protein PilP [Gammaproteobacteria bacterium]|nr:pilus assembly protein PilP [Gammaproteobacteria bacterium]